MSTKATTRTLPDAYFKLVRRFPLTHIRDDAHLGEAQEMIDRLLREDLDEGGQAYLDALTDLVEIYENENVSIPPVPPEGVLQELMNANGLSQRDLAGRVGIAQSSISAILAGRRRLNRDHIEALAEYFKVSPMLFIGPPR